MNHKWVADSELYVQLYKSERQSRPPQQKLLGFTYQQGSLQLGEGPQRIVASSMFPLLLHLHLSPAIICWRNQGNMEGNESPKGYKHVWYDPQAYHLDTNTDVKSICSILQMHMSESENLTSAQMSFHSLIAWVVCIDHITCKWGCETNPQMCAIFKCEIENLDIWAVTLHFLTVTYTFTNCRLCIVAYKGYYIIERNSCYMVDALLLRRQSDSVKQYRTITLWLIS